jgi:predicted transcriptional regulator
LAYYYFIVVKLPFKCVSKEKLVQKILIQDFYTKDTRNNMKALHPIQAKLIYILYNQNTSLYRIAQELNIPFSKLMYHVSQLYKKGFLIKQNVNGKTVYRVNKKVVKVTEDKKKNIFIWAKLPQS